VCLGHFLWHTHTPRFENDLAHLFLIDGVESHDNPVVALIAWLGHHELLGLRRDQNFPFLFGKGEAHERLVARESEIDEPPDPELHPVLHQGLIGPRKAKGELTNRFDRHHLLEPTLSQAGDLSPGICITPPCTDIRIYAPGADSNSAAPIASGNVQGGQVKIHV